MSLLNRNKGPRKKATKGFSELNKRTYEASSRNRAQRNYQQPGNRVQGNHQAYNNQQYNFQNSMNNSTYQQSPVASKTGNNRRTNKPTNLQDYSRQGASSSRYAKVHRKNKNKKRIKIAVAVAVGILVILGVIGFCFASNISKNMNEGMDNIGLTPTSLNQPFYTVLMGVDSSNERKANGGTDADYRSDSILLLRIDPVDKKATVMSLHRDTKVEIEGYGAQKLNAAHSIGGPELVIKTVSKLCKDVPISHYAEINFDAFKQAVDDVGGVEVDVPMTIDDINAGGRVEKGKQVLDGEHALILCRARHAYDAYGDGDKYRAANQRLVLSAIAQKCLNSDIATIAKTVTNLSQYIKTDINMSDIIGLAQSMKDIDFQHDVYSAMEPTEGSYEDGVWYEVVIEPKWTEMMKRMDEGKPPSTETVIDDATGAILSNAGDNKVGGVDGSFNATVSVRNGTEKEGVAAKASNKLTTLGFKTNVGNANSSDYKNTVIVYNDESQKAAAEAIKEALGCGDIQKNENEYVFDSDLLVVVGDDFS